MSMTYKPLPSYSDLFLLPAVLDPGSTTFLKSDCIAVKTDKPTSLLDSLRKYPNIDPYIDRDGHVLIRPGVHTPQYLLIAWPDGKTRAYALWPGKFFSYMEASTLFDLIRIGISVVLKRANMEDNFMQVLEAVEI